MQLTTAIFFFSPSFPFEIYSIRKALSKSYIMREANISPEVVVAIIFGILQLIMAAIALWQQHYLRWENCETPNLGNSNVVLM